MTLLHHHGLLPPLLAVVLLALDVAALSVGARGNAAEPDVAAHIPTPAFTASQREHTRRFLMAFAGPGSPLHDRWGRGDFCNWPLIRCQQDGVHLVEEGFEEPFSAVVPLPDVPSDVNASEVMLTHFSSLSSCTRLSFGGTLPASWAHLTHLRVLHVDAGSFRGTLPAEWGQMRGLERVTLTGECHWDGQGVLTGTLPAEWASMESLRALDLRHHRLSGTLPVQWAAFPNLRLLSLRSNELRGTLPAAWARMRSIQSIYAEGNAFTGSVPAEWRRGRFYTVLDEPLLTTQPAVEPRGEVATPSAAKWGAVACLFAVVLAVAMYRVESAASEVVFTDSEDDFSVDGEGAALCDSADDTSDFELLCAAVQPCVPAADLPSHG